MKSLRSAVPLMILLVVTPFTTAAQAAVAVLERLAGNPTIYEVGANGARKVSLPRQGAEYTLPIEIETGAADSATFRLPDSEVSVAPNTVMRVAAPEASEGGLLQRIFQKAGASLFSVDRRTVEHFQVETPYLVSVVKGTTFNVVVHDEGATVSLHEGRLQVNSVDGADQVILLPGDVAFSGRDGVLEKLEHTMAQQPAAESLDAAGDGDMDAQGALVPELGDVATLQAAIPEDLDLSSDTDVSSDISEVSRGMVDDLSADLGNDVVDGGGDLLADLGDVSQDLGDDLGDISQDLGDDLGGDLGDSTGDLVGDLGDSTGDLVGDLGDSTGDLVADLGDTAGDLVEDVGDLADDLTGDLAGDLTGDLTGDVGDLTGDVTQDLGDDVGDLTQDVGDGVGDLTQDLGDDVGDLTDDVGDEAGDLTGDLGDLIGLGDDLGDDDFDDDDGGLGGLLGGGGLL